MTIDYFRKTGIVPANHTLAVQKRLLNEHPWLALELFKLFREAKLAAYERAKRWSSAYLYFEGNDAANQLLSSATILFPTASKKIKRCWIFFSATLTKKA